LECNQLTRLVDYLDKDTKNCKHSKQLHKLHKSLCEVVEDFGLVQYLPLTILDTNSVGKIVIQVDKANGYTFAQNVEQRDSEKNEQKTRDMIESSIQLEGVSDLGGLRWSMSDIQEQFVGSIFSENMNELENNNGNIE